MNFTNIKNNTNKIKHFEKKHDMNIQSRVIYYWAINIQGLVDYNIVEATDTGEWNF